MPIVALLGNAISVLCGSFAGVKRDWSAIERTLSDLSLVCVSLEFWRGVSLFTHPVHMCSPFADSLGFCDSVSSEGLVGVYCMRDFGLLVVTPRSSNRLVGS